MGPVERPVVANLRSNHQACQRRRYRWLDRQACGDRAISGAATTDCPGIEGGVIATFKMYEIVVGRELRDEKSIGVTPDFAADANCAAIIDRVRQKLRDAISLCVN